MTKVEKNKKNLKKCLCMKCPNYTLGCKIKNTPKIIVDIVSGLSKKDNFEGLFCAYKKSKCITEKKGCICSDCEVSKENNLDKHYYCTTSNGE